MQNSYTVINASAGSGKTYALVQRLLIICLKYPDNHSAIRNILALTFTNKAANEMKERILVWLKNFTAESYRENPELKSIQEALKKEGINITMEDLHHRSRQLLDYILHHYSAFNIGTIDRFNSRLVRSFSQELGLAKNFNLEIKPEPFLLEAVDQMLDQIGENDEVSNAFMDYVNYGMDNEQRVNLNKTLYDASKEFINDIHYDHLKKNSAFDTANYEAATGKLRKIISELQQDSRQAATDALQIVKEKGLEKADFSGGKTQSIVQFFDKFIEDGIPTLQLTAEKEENKINTYLKGSSSQSKNKQEIILEILDYLLEKRAQIIRNHIEIQKNEKVLGALLPLKVNADVQRELQKIEDEKDVVLLSKFNILINENLKSEPSQFIYEKVGTQYQHYFFDEFQDTSALQWQNFIPLRNHSVSEQGTSFTLVGDPKQSIYRFRGGESKIMLDIINGEEDAPRKAELEILKDNWRSAQNIVEFNNKLYMHLSGLLQPEHQKIFGEDAQQNAQSTIEGNVFIRLIENATKDEFYSDTAKKMQEDIQQCLDAGFSMADITILCRGNKDIFNYSQQLGNLQVNFRGKVGNIKTISDSGLTLELSNTLNAVMMFLNWEANAENRQFLALMMYWLRESGRIATLDFTAEVLEILNLDSKEHICIHLKNNYGLTLYRTDFPKLNLYNFVEYYIHEFAVEGRETDFLLNFLEMVYGFTQNSGSTIKDLIKYWNEEAHKLTIQLSENVDAVQLMTVHKAKGLEFPVVFFPMVNKNKDSEFREWYDTENEFGLSCVNITQFGKGLDTYDQEIAHFNSSHSYRNLIDRICVQYVATTRPVEQLFLYIQKPNKTTNSLEIFDFVQLHNPQNLDSFSFYGTSEIKKAHQKKAAEATHHYTSIESLTKKHEQAHSIKIATPSKNYRETVEHVRAGIIAHDLLAEIKTGEDAEKAIQRYLLNGIITQEEENEVRSRINAVIANYPHYFANENMVINERDIMISENGITQVFRPDRLFVTHDGFYIIDFKTGKPKPEHETQVQNYRNLLEKLGKSVAGTEVIYV